ncbi:hypothetical protein [Myroides profundi]|uniref:Lipocalin-like domain-containing protein n=1 Tax=Myroides profundi TaxID=480520 RepID=A0AAJ4W6K7_MYRPR|nr:hypothetical protein [Myroides profundi]AJH15686.1 hypothetical protein MPR_2520 [Myroides profundi]SER49661.1 hypothetical protein SAMN04488089_11763 [Myroides profundi]
MKKLLSISCFLLTTFLFTSCSNDSGITVKTYFGKWESTTIKLKDGSTVKYTEIGTFNKNEELEVFTDQYESAKLVQYYSKEIKPTVKLGNVSDDFIVFENTNDKRQIVKVEQNELSLVTKISINGQLELVQINYTKIGPPRDEEPKK